MRAARRRQALDALAFEQDREAVLVEQLEDVIAEVEGARLDAELFAQLSLDEAQLVRTALGTDDDTDDEAEEETEPEDEAEAGEPEEDAEAEVEAEVVRLQAELELSRSAQAALARYLALVSQQPAGEAGAR